MKNIFTLLLIVTFFSTSLKGQEKFISSKNIDNVIVRYNVSIYPNPVQGNCFYISSPQIIQSVEIFDVLGKKIKTIFNETNIAYNIFVELADSERGMYIAKVVFKNKKIAIKKIYLK